MRWASLRHLARLVWGLDVRHLFAHRARVSLSVVGVASGIALATAVAALSSSIDASLEGVAAAVASRANLEVRATVPVGMPAQIVSEVRAVSGVRAAGATVESYTQLRSGKRSQRTLLIGIDPGMLQLRPRTFNAATVRQADPSGLFLPASIARDLAAKKGDKIEVATSRGWRSASVSAVLPRDVAGASRAAVGAIGIIQELLGKPGMVDAVYVDATDPDVVLPELRRAVGDRAQVGEVALRKREVREMVSAAITVLGAGSILALFVGAFLVYNTMSMAAVERTREAAILRATGASRVQVLLLFLSEGAALGILGSALGLGLGVLLAKTLLIGRGSALEEVYPIEFTGLLFQPRDLGFAMLAGVVAALLATVLPARRISRVDPASVLGESGALEDPSRRLRRTTIVVAILLLGIGASLASAFLTSQTLGSLGYVAFLAGMALLIPQLVPALAGALVGLLSRSRNGILRLAGGEVIRAPGRTSLTTGAVLLSLSIVVALAIAQASFSRTFRTDVREWLQADLYVRSATYRPFGSDVPIDASLAEELRQVPGVVTTYPYRLTSTSVAGRFAQVAGWDRESWAQLPGLSPALRRLAEREARTLGEPDAVIASRSAANLFRLEVGDEIDLPTPTGTVRRRVVAIDPDVSDISPSFTLSFSELSRLWGSNVADSFGVGVAPGTNVAQVKEEILRRFGRTIGVQVATREQFFQQINNLSNAVLGLVSSVQFVAVIIAGLGLANTLLMSTLERRRELGVVRAVGMLRRQVRRMVATEALIVGGLGVVLAWAVGTAIGLWVYAALKATLGEMQLVVPPIAYVASALLGLLGSAVASVYPAHRAARMNLLDALHYE